MLTQSLQSFRVLLILAIVGFTANCSHPAVAGDCGCETVCTECPSQSCDCAGECAPAKKSNLIYRALDKVAGGIEKALGLDKIHCDRCENQIICDDGCDAAMFGELSTFEEPGDQHGSLPIAPVPQSSVPQRSAPRISAPSIESVPSYSPPTHEPNPRSQLRMGEPTMNDPHAPIPDPSFTPPTQPRQRLTNPFQDDARVTGKRRVRATSLELQAQETAPRSKTRKPSNRKNSRGYSPSKRLARSVQ